MINRLFIAKSGGSQGSFANGIQPAPSLVLGHNYEQNGNDVTGTYPLGFSSGSPAYADNWSGQGYGLTNFNTGGLKYFVSSGINAVFETGTFTVAWHIRTTATGTNFNGGPMLLADGSTFDGAYARFNGSGLFQFNCGGLMSATGTTWQTSTNYHIAVTRDGTDMRLYVNATLDASSVTASGSVGVGGTQYKIGDGLASDFEIYDYGVWNIKMTPTQVTNIMNNLAP